MAQSVGYLLAASGPPLIGLLRDSSGGWGLPLDPLADPVSLLFDVIEIVASMASVMALLGMLKVEVEGYRDLSLFMSHIRFSLMVVLSILIVVWYLF